MWICSNCGQRNSDDQVMCKHCGYKKFQNRGFQGQQYNRYQSQLLISNNSPYNSNYSQGFSNQSPYGFYNNETMNNPLAYVQFCSPEIKHNTNRKEIKFFFLSIITLGIYAIITFNNISKEINIIASEHDNKSTTNYLSIFLLSLPFCLFYKLPIFWFFRICIQIIHIVWWHRICKRIGDELDYREIDYQFGSIFFWIWSFILPSLFTYLLESILRTQVRYQFNTFLPFILIPLLGISIFVFLHKFFRSINLLNEDYNKRGSNWKYLDEEENIV